MDASHRLHQELLTAFGQLLREQQHVPEPTSPKPQVPDKWVGRVYVNTRGAAERMGVSHRTSEQWRIRGGGPRSFKLGGGVRYEVAELDKWLASRRRRSTSDPGEGEPPDR